MKLLFDENISWRIRKLLEPHFPKCKHISDINKKIVSDNEIWEYAKINSYLIVTFDEDSSEIQTINNFPPKILWLRCGNTSTKSIAEKLISIKNEIFDFFVDNEKGVFEIY